MAQIEDSSFLEKWGPTILLLFVLGTFATALLAMYAVITALQRGAEKELGHREEAISKTTPQVGYVQFTTQDYIDKTTGVLTNIWNHTYFPSYRPGMLGIQNIPHFPPEKQHSGVRALFHGLKQELKGKGSEEQGENMEEESRRNTPAGNSL